MKKFLSNVGLTLVIAGIAAVVLWVLCLAGCTEVAPQVRQNQPSFTSTGQDSGILDDIPGSAGVPVNQDWIDGYDALLKKFGSFLFPPRKKGDRDGIVKEGGHYRITDAVWERQLVLNQRRINEAGP